LNPGIVSSRTRTLLKIGHVPEADRIVGRDEEISKLAKRLNGAVHGYSPENVMIYGKTGTVNLSFQNTSASELKMPLRMASRLEQRISTVLKTILRLRRSPHLLRS